MGIPLLSDDHLVRQYLGPLKVLEVNTLIAEFKDEFVGIYHGTTYLGEAFCIILRCVKKDFSTVLRLVKLVILHHYDKGSETASEPNEWRKLYQELEGCLGEVEKDMGLLDMEVTHATVTLPPGVAIRQLFTHFAINPISSMPALQVNICQALDIHPVGMQWCAVQAGGGFKLQGLQGEAPLFYLSMWEPLAQALRSRLAFTGNTATFDFTSLTGKGIKVMKPSAIRL